MTAEATSEADEVMDEVSSVVVEAVVVDVEAQIVDVEAVVQTSRKRHLSYLVLPRQRGEPNLHRVISPCSINGAMGMLRHCICVMVS